MKFDITDELVKAHTTFYMNESGRDEGMDTKFPDHVRGVSLISDSGLNAKLDVSSPVLHMTPLPRFLVSTLAWLPLPLSEQLGMPMKYKHSPYHPGFDSAMKQAVTFGKGPASAFRNESSNVLSILTMNCDITLPDEVFGKPGETTSKEIMLARKQYQHLENSHAQAFVSYVDHELYQVRELIMKGDVAAAKAIAAIKVTPKAFAMYYKQIRARKILDLGVKDLKELNCPIEVPTPFGEQCGEEHTEDGKALLTCGKCKWATYCSKKCQIADWKAHKVICRPREVFDRLLNKTVGKNMGTDLPRNFSFGMFAGDTYLGGGDWDN